jgi:hypothetical protein
MDCFSKKFKKKILKIINTTIFNTHYNARRHSKIFQ